MTIDFNQLTNEQKIGVQKIKDFLKLPINIDNPLTRVIVLKGQAGTGKTTMLKLALEEVLETDKNIAHESVKTRYDADLFNQGILGCVGVTVSHKAKKVLNRSIPITTTYASYFSMIQDNDEFGNRKFVPNPDINKRESALYKKPHKVVVHDEVSMYDEDMLNYILANTDPITKIILVGDPGQLPPIKETGEDGYLTDEDSPAFEWFKETMIVLTEKVRQTKGNPIIELTDFIYEQIFTEQNIGLVLELMQNSKYNDGIGYRMLQYRDFLKEYTTVTQSFLDSKLLAYKNNSVNFYNKTIRDFIYKNPSKKIISGELIYMNETFQFSRFGFLYNSDEYIINDVDIVTENEVECYKCYIDPSLYPHLKNEKAPFFLIPTENGQKQYDKSIFFMKKFINEQKNAQLKRKAWARYFSYINKFSKISYGYCFTAYKAQGSTYKNVFIDVNDILSLDRLSSKRKLQALYTAITRASHSVYFLH